MPFQPVPLGRGLYTAADARSVPQGMAQALDNVHLDRDPQARPLGVQVRNGYTTYGTIPGVSSGGIVGGIEFRTSFSTTELLWTLADATLYKGTPATVVTNVAGRGGNLWHFLNVRDPADGNHKVYFTPGYGLWMYNTGSVTELKGAASVYAPNLAADPPEEPNRLADTTDDIHYCTAIGTAWGSLAVANKDRIYISHPLQLSYFPLNNYWDVVTAHNDWITAIYGGVRGSVVVAKESSLFLLRGSDFEDSILHAVSAHIGCPSQNTMQPAEELGGVIFQGSDGHVYLLGPDSGNLTCLSHEIEGTIAQLQAAFVFANAWVWDRKYWLRTCYPTGIPQLVLAYDFTTRAWEYHDTYPQGFSAFPYNGKMLLGTTDATLVDITSGTTDNGTPITGTYQTGQIAPAGPSVKHLYRSLYLTAKGSGVLTVTMTVDGVARVRTVNLGTDFKEYRLDINAAGKWLDVKLSGGSWHALGPAMLDYQVLDVGRASA